MLRAGVPFSCNEDVEMIICCYSRQEAYDRIDLFLERLRYSYRFSGSVYDLLVAEHAYFFPLPSAYAIRMAHAYL